jgi:hypothetical protein
MAIALGWRVSHSTALVVAVGGTPEAPVVVHRDHVTLIEDESIAEPYHVAAGRPIEEAPAFLASVEESAARTAEAIIRGLASSLGPVVAVGVVGGNRRLPELSRILVKHALLHAADRDLHEQAIAEGATRGGVLVTMVPATGTLIGDASALLGIDVTATLAAAGKAVGPPWTKEHREATTAALVALRS